MKLASTTAPSQSTSGPECGAVHESGLSCTSTEGHLERGVPHSHEGEVPGVRKLKAQQIESGGQWIYMGPVARYSLWDQPTDELQVFDR